MKQIDLVNLLSEEDFHLDPLGRVVIDNPEILAAINGAMLEAGRGDELLINAGCTNAGC